MLEEALKDPSRNPADTALAMRTFISQDLPIGGTATGDRFFHQLFTPLCARIFGELKTDISLQRSRSSSSGSTGDDVSSMIQHEPGGWLSVQNRWRRVPPPSSSSSGMPRAVPGVVASVDADPVVQLLGPKKAPSPGSKTANNSRNNNSNNNNNNNSEAHMRSIIETLTVEMMPRSGVFFPFPFPALPASVQQQFLLVLEAVVVHGTANNTHPTQQYAPPLGWNVDSVQQVPPGSNARMTISPNAYRLFTGLLRMAPEGQVQVKAYQQKKLQEKNLAQPLQLSPGLASPQARTPTSPNNTNLTSTPAEAKEDIPNFLLSALEYYLFLFVRYPLASPSIPRPTVSSPAGIHRYPVVHRSRMPPPYGETIYRTTFQRYLDYFLPHTPYPTVEAEFPDSKLPSELFLRLVVAFWLESPVMIPTTTQAVQALRDRYRRTGLPNEPAVDLKLSYDLAFGHQTYQPLPSLAQQCLRSLTIHLLKDPTIYHSVVLDHQRHWCLGPAMTALQQPFYNYVRSSFRHAPIHAPGSAFYSAMNAWLIWLEPWNVSHTSNASARLMNSIPGKSSQTTSGPTMTIPKGDRKSGYAQSWEPYLAANLFLYTVPLAIFLRRARELDFSPREFHRSLELLKRVFRVYTPEVIQALTNLTANYTMKNPVPGGSSKYTKTVENHKALLGEYAPSTMGDLSLASCQSDMQGLLEEMHMAHTKRVRDLGYGDKLAAYLEGLFSRGVVSGEEMAIQSMVERARVIVGFPVGYEILPSEASASSRGAPGKTATTSDLRTPEGMLTDEGRQLLLTGQYKCSPTDVHYLGDKTQARIRSHEIAVLVTLTNFLSHWLNERLGLLPPTINKVNDKAASTKKQAQFQKNLAAQDNMKGFRISLRWFADYRNLCFAMLMAFLVSRTVF